MLPNFVTHSCTHSKGWLNIEQHSFASGFLREVLRDAPKDRPHSSNLFLSLHVWDSYYKNLLLDLSTLTSFLGQTWLLPGKEQCSFSIWCKVDIYCLHDIITSGKQLELQHNIQLPWYQYNQPPTP